MSRGSRLCRAALGLSASIAGCAGLPPKPAPVVLPTEAPIADLGGGGSWPAPDWWTQYRDPTLDRLIEMALRYSPTLATAHARFESARQSVRIASTATGARLQANGDASRQRLSDNGLFPPQLLGFTWYNQMDLGLQASYTFDWWGKQRDAVEAAIDDAHASHADRSAAALMLASSVADTYFGWQADQSRLALAREREITVQREAAVTAARIGAELDSADESQRAGAALASVREQIAVLEGSAALRVVALAALVGRAPADLPPLAPKPMPSVAGGLPDEVRIDLIARRADVTASRWRVEAAENSRESARAEFFPDVSINALLGVQSIHMSTLIEYGSRVPDAAVAIHLPLFDAGRLKARYGATRGGAGCGGGRLPGYRGQRRARRGDAGIDPGANRGAANPARDRARCGAQTQDQRRGARAAGPHRFENRIERHRCVDRAAGRLAGARCGRRLGGHRAEARARRRL